jgi:hypothetical protein
MMSLSRCAGRSADLPALLPLLPTPVFLPSLLLARTLSARLRLAALLIGALSARLRLAALLIAILLHRESPL